MSWEKATLASQCLVIYLILYIIVVYKFTEDTESVIPQTAYEDKSFAQQGQYLPDLNQYGNLELEVETYSDDDADIDVDADADAGEIFEEDVDLDLDLMNLPAEQDQRKFPYVDDTITGIPNDEKELIEDKSPEEAPQIKSRLSKGVAQLAKVGKWLPGTTYDQTCMIDGRSDFSECCKNNVYNLHFEFFDKTMSNNESVLHEFVSKVKGKKVMIMGDSVQQNFFAGIAEVLRLGTDFHHNFEQKGSYLIQWHWVTGDKKPPFSLRLLKFFTYRSFEHCSTYPSGLILSEMRLRRAIKGADIIIFNLGLHLQSCTNPQFQRKAIEMANIIAEEVSLKPQKQVIVRSTLPVHGPDTTSLFKRACQQEARRDHFSNYHLKEIADKYGFKFLFSAPIYKERGDLHFPERMEIKPDCTHWCYTPELIVPELALLNKLLH